MMKNLIFSKDNSIEPNGLIGLQKWGIIFWQKTGFLHHCNELGFQSMVTLIKKRFSPTSVQLERNICFFQFDNDEKKMIFLMLKKERKSNHYFIYVESHTVYAGAEFHLFALNVVSYIAKKIGCKFYVDDATEYLNHRSEEKLEQYIKDFDIKPAVSDDQFEKSMIEHQNRPLDINEILSRKTERNVVVDAYEYFMRQSNWKIDSRFNDTVKNFLLCVLYDGEVGNGGISQFLASSSGNFTHQTADALHVIGAVESEKLLRKSFKLFPNGIVPKDENERNNLIDQFKDNPMDQLDINAYDTDIYTFCYRYLTENKKLFLAE